MRALRFAPALKPKETRLSSDRSPRRRNLLLGCAPALSVALAVAAPLAAQDRTSGDPEEDPEEDAIPAPGEFDGTRINILVTVPRGEVNQAQAQECTDRADAGRISGEIVVCRQRGENGDNYYSGSREDARRRYAEETAFRDDPATPDVAGAGIFRGPGTVSGACFIPPCPGEPALFIDIEALPEAPAGSDADRIARGLPPLGEYAEPEAEEIARRRRALGLPAPPVGDR